MPTALTVEPKSTLVLKLFQYYSIRTLNDVSLYTELFRFLGQNRSAKLEVYSVDLQMRYKVRGLLNSLQGGEEQTQ